MDRKRTSKSSSCTAGLSSEVTSMACVRVTEHWRSDQSTHLMYVASSEIEGGGNSGSSGNIEAELQREGLRVNGVMNEGLTWTRLSSISIEYLDRRQHL
jgi:hypothetical protein